MSGSIILIVKFLMAEDFDIESLAYLEQTYVLLANPSVYFANILHISFFDTGYTEGYAHGRIHGLIEGRALGHEKGFEMWEELGFYEGFARGWKAILHKGCQNSSECVFVFFFGFFFWEIGRLILFFEDGQCNIFATF
jgi:hypothetical protein